jgi:hypothetical protein
MFHPTTPTSTPFVTTLLAFLADARPATRQRRTHLRLGMLTLAGLLALGRHTLSQLIVTLGAGQQEWSPWYRLFSRCRVRTSVLQRQVLTTLLGQLGPDDPLVVVLDATQVPRSSRRFPGVGWTRALRSPYWKPGIHLAQRLELLSGLLPLSANGESRAVPISETWLRAAATRAVGDLPEQTEVEGGLRLLHWLRLTLRLAVPHEADRVIVVLADGAYSVAPMLSRLPQRCVLLARCAKHRALFALPVPQPSRRGRKRCYGERGPTPQQTLHQRTGWHTDQLLVRGRERTLRTVVTGPWVVRKAANHPVFLLVVKGVDRGRGTTRRQRDPQFFLISAVRQADGGWELPLPRASLLQWAWQRWEVEVMHRELKSGFGLGQAQAWTTTGMQQTTRWVLWSYALVVLTAYQHWAMASPDGGVVGCWHQPRRWSVGRALQQIRAELWRLPEFAPGWVATPDPYAEIAAWWSTQTTAVLGQRRL